MCQRTQHALVFNDVLTGVHQDILVSSKRTHPREFAQKLNEQNKFLL